MTNLYMPDATLPALFEFVRCESGAVRTRQGAELWLNLPHEHDFPLYMTVRATPRLAEFVAGNSIYGSEKNLDQSHFLEMVFRDDDTALVVLRYQHILGSRWLCIVPKSDALNWVNSNVRTREYTVSYETRKRGAIGVFECRTFKVRARDDDAARAAARDEADKQGYETRFPLVTRWKD